MAKFTSTAPLNIRWQGYDLSGPAGTIHRIDDALYEEFQAAFDGIIPGLSWTDTDEVGGTLTSPIAQTDVTGLVADLAAKVDTSSLTAYVPKSGATMVGTLTGPAFGATGRPWFDVRAFGAVGDGTTDDQAAIQAAVTSAAAARGTVYIPAGTYRIASAVALSSNVRVIGEGDATIIKCDHSGYAFTAAGTLGTLITVATDIVRGATTIVGSSSLTGLADGDIYWLQSEAQPLENATSKNAELGVIASSSGSTATVYGNIQSVYNTSDTAKVAEVTPVRNITIRDLAIYNVGYTATTTSTNPLIGFDFGVNVGVFGCHLYQNNAAGIMFRNCLNGRAAGNVIENLRDDDGNSIYGYGVFASHATRGLTVTGNTMRKCRHGFTTGTSSAGPTPNYGVSRAITVSDNVISDCTHFSLDTHEDTRGIAFVGNAISGGKEGGIQVRSYDNIIANNTIHSVIGIGIYLRALAQDSVVIGNHIAAVFQQDSSTGGLGIYTDSGSTIVSSNRIYEVDRHGIYMGANANNVHAICGNSIQGNTLDGINVDDAVALMTLTGNVITGNSRYGVRFESAVVNSDRIILAANIISNNTSADFSNAGTGTPQSIVNGDGDGPGFTQRKRVTTGSIALSTSSSITVTWPQAFADANYTISASCLEANGDLRVKNIISQAAGSCVIRVTNDSAASARTGTLHVVAVHD